MDVLVSHTVKLSEDETRRIVRHYFGRIHKGRWVENGKLMERHYTPHRFDAVAPDQSDFQLVQALQNLERMLVERKLL
jgi:hypothetical protein